MVAAPISFTEDPGQMLHDEVQLRGEVRADECGSRGPLAPGYQTMAAIVATVLRSNTAAVLWQQGAQAQACRGMVDVHEVLRVAGILPLEAAAQVLIKHTDNMMYGKGGIHTWAVGQILLKGFQVLGEEVTIAAHPLLTYVFICKASGWHNCSALWQDSLWEGPDPAGAN